MNRQNRKGKRSVETVAATPPSPIHAWLNMTPEEVSADIASRGRTEKSILRDFSLMEKRLSQAFDGVSKAPSGGGAAKDYRLDSFAGETLAGEAWGTVKIVRVARELENPWDEPGFDDVALETTATPKDGDLVLVRQFGEAPIEVVRKLRLRPDGQARLDPIGGIGPASEFGHVSTFVICGVVVARAI